MYNVDNTRWETCFMCILSNFICSTRRFTGRLEDNGVSFHYRRADEPQGNGKWKVPWGNCRNNSLGFSAHECVFFRNLRVNHVAVRHPYGTKYVLHHVDPFCHIGTALNNSL